MTKYYPIMLDINKKPTTVIGGGKVAERKVISLLEHGAKVTVISPQCTKTIENLWVENRIQLMKRNYQTGDLVGSFLVYVATDDVNVSEGCHREAKENNIMINVVDVPYLCDFIVPAIHRQGSLTIAVSTDGKSPMFSRKIREELQQQYGKEYIVMIDTLGEIRDKALKEISDIEIRKQLFNQLVYERPLKESTDVGAYQEYMWKTYEFYRSGEGKHNEEKNKNWV